MTAHVYYLGRLRCVTTAVLFDIRCAYCHDGKAGILPGLTYYLSAWYPKAVLGRRIGILYAGSTLANAFGGLLAFAIEKMNGCDPFDLAYLVGSNSEILSGSADYPAGRGS